MLWEHSVSHLNEIKTDKKSKNIFVEIFLTTICNQEIQNVCKHYQLKAFFGKRVYTKKSICKSIPKWHKNYNWNKLIIKLVHYNRNHSRVRAHVVYNIHILYNFETGAINIQK